MIGICSYCVLDRPVFERCQTLLHPELTPWWSFLLADGAHHKKPHSPTHPTSTFKHLTVKQVFPREPYRLKVHRDAQYLPKSPAESGFSDSKAPSSYQISQHMCLDTEELARRSAIYASLADSMVASVIEELSLKDQRSKLLQEKLAIIQEAQVSAVSARFAAASNHQLLRRDGLPKNFGFQPQVWSTVRTAPFQGSHILGMDPKELQNSVRAIQQADRMAGSSVTFVQKPRETKTSTKVTSFSRKNQSRTSVYDRLGSPTAMTAQRTGTQDQPFRAGTGRGAHHRPYPEQRKKTKKTSSASSTRQRWRGPGGGSPGGLCPTVEESAGHLPGHRHCRGRGGHYFPWETSAHPSVHQLPDQKQPARPPAGRGRLAVEGGHRVGHQRDIPWVLQPTVSGAEENRSSSGDWPFHSQLPHGSSTLQDGAQGSVYSAIRSQEWTVSIDIRDAYLHVPMHQAVRKYLRFVVNKQVYQFTCLPFGLATSPRELTRLLRPVVALLRQRGVKLHVYLDDWLIRADTPEQAQLHAQPTIRVLQFLGWIINYEKSDLTPSQDFQFIGMQFNTRQFTVAPLPKMCLKVQSVHQHWMTNPNITAHDLHRLLGMLVFMASLVQRGRLRLRPVQWLAATAWCERTGSWTDRITVLQWVLSEVAWWASPAVLQGLSLSTKET